MSDGIVLVGLPGSGKTAVGRCLAELLGRPFIDLDEDIEQATGRTPAQHIQQDGEAAFRALERQAVARAVQVAGAVIATGGGAPLDPLNRWAIMEHGLRVRLDVPLDRLAARLATDAVTRPLLGEDALAGLSRTAEQRAPYYRAVDVAISGLGDPHDVAAAVNDARERINLADCWRTLYEAAYARHHPVGPPNGGMLMGRSLTPAAMARALRPFDGRAAAVIADRRALSALPRLDAALPAERRLTLDGGEQIKSFAVLERLLTWLSEQGVERSDPLLAVGGGTVGDVAGLAAALHQRGMPLVQLPTTWLAQADSAIGGKVAIDLPTAKNAVGAVWPACLIVSDVSLLESLPIDRRRDGLAECLKMGLIGDPALWALVEQRGPAALHGEDGAAAYAMTERAARLKLEVVARDPYESGERRVLNLGHTLGHALEIESHYALSHGEAVALGLRAVARIASARGAQAGLAERIDTVLAALGFPLRRRFDPAAVTAALRGDKKRELGTQRWILPMAVGQVEEVSDVTPVELSAAMEAIGA
ncbi:MAG TPA: bifunctional shikimate kinase/3-dehydroquinate synthase [Candidatus Limnocylindria bacterium]|nr:bifunctional shikimate kinase/3-dehydroquinate synthase [Candidatus Limnocylindria bacterium]